MKLKSAMYFDVAIVGGGMVGLALAAELAQHAVKVAIIDRGELQLKPPPCYQSRVSALTRASENQLRALGAWALIATERRVHYIRMRVLDEQSAGELEFLAQDLAEPNLGHIIENEVIRRALFTRLQGSNSVRIFQQQQLAGLQIDSNECRLHLMPAHSNTDEVQTHTGPIGTTRISAGLVVGADGARSWLRAQVGIPVSRKDYQQSALVALIGTAERHQLCAWQRFLRTGPLAFLPTPEAHRCAIVWSMDTSMSSELVDTDAADFLQRLERATAGQFGTLELLSPRAAFPLEAIHARRYVGHRVALVGDAAHSIHPLAGQGVNLGFLDAQALAGTILSALEAGDDPARVNVLRRYERLRRGDNLLVQQAMSLLQTGFARADVCSASLRGWGMNMLNRAPVLKQHLIRRAMRL